jgi:hypothetical protein
MNKVKFVFLIAAMSFVTSCSSNDNGVDGIDGIDGFDGKNGKNGKNANCIFWPNEKDGYDIICDNEKVGELTNGIGGIVGVNGKNGKDANCVVLSKPKEADGYDIFCDDEKIGEMPSCYVEDNEAWFVMRCGGIERSRWAKAMCGTSAYNPETQACCGTKVYNPLEMACDYRDEKMYRFIKIDEQYWLVENMNYYIGSSMCYDNTADNCEIYGRLYNWQTAQTACLAGWHLPSNDEWAVFENLVAVPDFSIVHGGYFNADAFHGITNSSYWWTSTEELLGYAFSRYISFDSDVISTQISGIRSSLYSVRCVRDYL